MRRAVVQLLFLVTLLGLPGVAQAHTEFEYSDPADGVSVDEPVSEIVIAFTLPVTIVGNGFEVFDPSGEIVRPAIQTDDDRVYTLVMSRPLAGGDVGVRFEVAADDGHVLADSFSFTVAAPAASTTTTSAPVTTSTVSDPTTISVSTTIEVTGTSEQPAGSAGSMWLWLVGAGLLAGVGIGLFLSVRSRSGP